VNEIPLEQIKSVNMIIGERCRVESLNDGHTRTLTITTEDGVICVFKGAMEFTWMEAS
jgi:hypothetical protein